MVKSLRLRPKDLGTKIQSAGLFFIKVITFIISALDKELNNKPIQLIQSCLYADVVQEEGLQLMFKYYNSPFNEHESLMDSCSVVSRVKPLYLVSMATVQQMIVPHHDGEGFYVSHT